MLALYDKKYAGHISVAFDGVAVLGCSQKLCTVSKDDASMVVDMAQLGQHAHVADAAVIDAVLKLQNIREFVLVAQSAVQLSIPLQAVSRKR
jgi:hypothetical protein